MSDAIPTDRLLEGFHHYLKGCNMTLRDPHWKSDHPTRGTAGVQYVWRFGKVGVRALSHIGVGGWEVTPMRYTGIEINSFVPDGETLTGQTPEQIETLLSTYAPAPGVKTPGTFIPAAERAARQHGTYAGVGSIALPGAMLSPAERAARFAARQR